MEKFNKLQRKTLVHLLYPRWLQCGRIAKKAEVKNQFGEKELSSIIGFTLELGFSDLL